MRRIVVSCALAAALAFAALLTTATAQADARAKAKTAKAAAVPRHGNADAIGEQELRAYDYFLASDQLEGRNFPSRGYDAAALYVASHLAEWGLQPGGSATGTNGPLQPYFMPIELVALQTVPEQSKASLTAPVVAGRGGFGGRGADQGAGSPEGGPRGDADAAPELRTTSFEYGREWTMGGAGGFGGRGGASAEPLDVSGNLVFAGNGYVINKTKINPYEGLDVHGKIIVVAGLPPELAAQQAAAGRGRGGRGGAEVPNPLGENCTDYLTPEEYAAKNGAVAVVTLAGFQQLTAMTNPNAGAGRAGRGPSVNGPNFQVVKFQRTSACPTVPVVTAGLELTNALFQGAKLTGAEVFYGAGSNTKQDSFDLGSRKKLSLHLAVRSEPGHGENVIGILEGGDPVLKNEYVVMSAHLDHLGLSSTPTPDGHSVYSGADDDGSGSTGLLAIAHAYADGAAKGMRPRRTIVFLWDGGEEKGLLGSQYFTQFPPFDLTRVVANLNMDMIGRSKNANSVDANRTHVLVKPGEVMIVGPNVSSDDLEQTIETVNGNYQKMELNHFYDAIAPDATHDNLGPQPRGQRVFYRSDHYNFAKMGIPVAFFTTGLHADYHRLTDTPDKIDYNEIQQISRTVAAVGWELANQDGRPKLKDHLPDDLTKDMKTAQSQGWGKITPVLPPLPGEPH